MFVTIINDCKDENAMSRQATRASTLLGLPVNTLGVGWSEIEASGNIIDVLDASAGSKGVVMANVAVRHGHGKKWPNGSPFGYFYYKDTLIISTIGGFTLSLVKKFGLTKKIHLTDVPTVVRAMVEQGKLPPNLESQISNSQFRSYDYIPRLAQWLQEGVSIPHEDMNINEVEDIGNVIWWIDNFGNCKTTILPEEIGFEGGKRINTRFGEFNCYNRLKDVPNEETAVIVGSSGLGEKRFLEFVTQGGSTSKKYGIKTGDLLIE